MASGVTIAPIDEKGMYQEPTLVELNHELLLVALRECFEVKEEMEPRVNLILVRHDASHHDSTRTEKEWVQSQKGRNQEPTYVGLFCAPLFVAS